ncbi:unnamed protein product [Haemonchus placei]|uniref:Uncharacterized protein n=1 Tax=Haemonchus placei TaxID=6290 RepID=A0A0N4XBS4_HAEPC|nr:unnamed protein product [Haemonchus placei]
MTFFTEKMLIKWITACISFVRQLQTASLKIKVR